jgi:hypothetical protein
MRSTAGPGSRFKISGSLEVCLTMRRPSSHISLAVVPALLLIACQKNAVTVAKVPKEAPQPAAAAMPGSPMGMGMGAPPAEHGAPRSALRWKLPKGWTDSPASGMRYATLKAPAEGKLDISVTMLAGTAGGELANVNRWRGQIGLPPVEESALGKSRQVVKTPAGEIALYDFTGEGEKKTRMVVGSLTSPDGNSWFLKAVGDEAAVAAARADFVQLLETLRFE